MPVKWHQTQFQGVRYYEHKTRKHGIQRDRYFAIRYQREGKRCEEGLGWSSSKEGWTAEKAAIELAKLKQAYTLGEGPNTLREKRKLRRAKEEAEQQAEKKANLERLTFDTFFKETYYPTAQISKKESSYKKEEQRYRRWIFPIIGEKPFKLIAQTDLERIKKTLLDAGRSPKMIEHVFEVIRQAWNMARRDGLITKESPTRQVRIPKKDNKRLRFLTHDEADALLDHLKLKNTQLHDIVLLSLHTGLRAGEIFSLTWSDIDLDRGLITIRDPKAVKNRVAYMTTASRKLFQGKSEFNHEDLIFPEKTHGGRINAVSGEFKIIVDELGLNKGIIDPRQKVVFHSLRHTFASWLVENGTDLYTVKELMGHHTISMTERYSHVGNNALHDAVKRLDKRLTRKKGKGKDNLLKIKRGRFNHE